MPRNSKLTLFFCLLFSVSVMAQTPITPPNLNNPDDPPCIDPTNTAVCSQDFFWVAPVNGPIPDYYEVFRRTVQQTGSTTAWVKIGNATETRWWTALDAGDSEVNAAGEVRAGHQKPGFMYEYRVRSCRHVPETWTIVCSSFSVESIFFEGVVYERLN